MHPGFWIFMGRSKRYPQTILKRYLQHTIHLAWQQRAKAEQTMTSTIGRLFLQIARNSANLMEHFGLSEQDPQFHSLVHAGPNLWTSLGQPVFWACERRSESWGCLRTIGCHRSFRVLAQVMWMTWFLQADFEDARKSQPQTLTGEQPPVCAGLKPCMHQG